MKEKTYIYESPDAGGTVYRREMLTNKKELHYRSPEVQREIDRTQRRTKWRAILEAAENDTQLLELIEKAEMYYELKKEY